MSLHKAKTLKSASIDSLEDLMIRAEQCATLSMRKYGRILATFFILTGDRSLVMLRADMADEESKDASVRIARLFCAARAASAVVVLAEAWMTTKEKGQKYGPPIADPERKEVVILLGEAYGKRKQKFMPILRTTTGAFRALENDDSDYDGVGGRFSNLLPAHPPTPEIQAEAESFLEAVGLTTEVSDVPNFPESLVDDIFRKSF